MNTCKRITAVVAFLATGLAASLALATPAQAVAPPGPEIAGLQVAQHTPAPAPAARVRAPEPTPTSTTPKETFGFPATQAAFIAYLETGELTAEQWRVLPQMAAIYRTTVAELVARGAYGEATAGQRTLDAINAAVAKGKTTGRIT